MRRVAPSTGEKMKLHRRRWHGPHLDHQETLLRTTPDGSAQGTARLASSAPHMTSFSGPRWMRQVEEQLPRGAAPHTPPRALEEAEPSQSLCPARGGCGGPGNQRFWATAPHWEKWTPGPKGPGPLFRSTTSRSHKNVCL